MIEVVKGDLFEESLFVSDGFVDLSMVGNMFDEFILGSLSVVDFC